MRKRLGHCHTNAEESVLSIKKNGEQERADVDLSQGGNLKVDRG